MIKKKSNHYFTQDHEDAIIKYALSNDRAIRTKLYIEFIQPAFDEMVDKIIFTYKFNTLPNIDYLRDECKIWLTTILDKYDTTKGSKAFSYYSVITKNWFIQNVKKTNKERKREVLIDDAEKELEEASESEPNDYERGGHTDMFPGIYLYIESEVKNTWCPIKEKEFKRHFETLEENRNRKLEQILQ